MSVATSAIAAQDGHTVVVSRKAPDGRVLPRQVQVRTLDGSSFHFDYDERGRIERMVRNTPGGKEQVQGYPKGTSLHELGLHKINSEVQHLLAKNRREHGARDVAA